MLPAAAPHTLPRRPRAGSESGLSHMYVLDVSLPPVSRHSQRLGQRLSPAYSYPSTPPPRSLAGGRLRRHGLRVAPDSYPGPSPGRRRGRGESGTAGHPWRVGVVRKPVSLPSPN